MFVKEVMFELIFKDSDREVWNVCLFRKERKEGKQEGRKERGQKGRKEDRKEGRNKGRREIKERRVCVRRVYKLVW